MDKRLIYSQIRNTVDASLPGSRILVFGSQARGDSDSFSDFDVLIITPETFSSIERRSWISKLNRLLVHAIKAPVDLIMNSEEEIQIKRDLPGHIVQTALREGIAI